MYCKFFLFHFYSCLHSRFLHRRVSLTDHHQDQGHLNVIQGITHQQQKQKMTGVVLSHMLVVAVAFTIKEQNLIELEYITHKFESQEFTLNTKRQNLMDLDSQDHIHPTGSPSFPKSRRRFRELPRTFRSNSS